MKWRFRSACIKARFWLAWLCRINQISQGSYNYPNNSGAPADTVVRVLRVFRKLQKKSVRGSTAFIGFAMLSLSLSLFLSKVKRIPRGNCDKLLFARESFSAKCSYQLSLYITKQYAAFHREQWVWDKLPTTCNDYLVFRCAGKNPSSRLD